MVPRTRCSQSTFEGAIQTAGFPASLPPDAVRESAPLRLFLIVGIENALVVSWLIPGCSMAVNSKLLADTWLLFRNSQESPQNSTSSASISSGSAFAAASHSAIGAQAVIVAQ